MMTKLQKIEINQYRGIKNMTLDNLSRINVLVGGNNSGKTSILEAIQLLSNPFSEALVFNVAIQRLHKTFISQTGEALKWMFSQDSNGHQPIDLALYQADKKIAVTFEFFEKEVGIETFQLGERITDMIVQEIHVKLNSNEKVMTHKGSTVNSSEPYRNDIYKLSYVSSDDRIILDTQIGKIFLDQKKTKLIEMLQQFDAEIAGIEIIPVQARHGKAGYIRNQIYIQKKDKSLAPIYTFGDGLQKVVYIASKLLNLQNGVLLLDEAEVSIHTKMIPTFFEWLSKLAEQHNVTIFMTTHSIEAVDGVIAASKESLENLSFYRLEKKGVKYFSGKRMHSVRYESAMEVRG